MIVHVGNLLVLVGGQSEFRWASVVIYLELLSPVIIDILYVCKMISIFMSMDEKSPRFPRFNFLGGLNSTN